MGINRHGFETREGDLSERDLRWLIVLLALTPICMGFMMLIADHRIRSTWENGTPAIAHILSVNGDTRSEGFGVNARFKINDIPEIEKDVVVRTQKIFGETRYSIAAGDEIDVKYIVKGENLKVAFKPPSPAFRVLSMILIFIGLVVARSYMKTRNLID